MEGMKKDNQRLLDLLNLREKEISDLKGEVEKAAEDARILEERMHRNAQL